MTLYLDTYRTADRILISHGVIRESGTDRPTGVYLIAASRCFSLIGGDLGHRLTTTRRGRRLQRNIDRLRSRIGDSK